MKRRSANAGRRTSASNARAAANQLHAVRAVNPPRRLLARAYHACMYVYVKLTAVSRLTGKKIR